MGLAQDLETLQRQRGEEVHTLHQTYLRTKRSVIRTASPERILRRHIGLFLAAGAAVGLILAPGPTPRTPDGSYAPRRKRRLISSLRWLKKMVASFAPQVARYIPDLPLDDDASPSSSPSPRKEHAEAHEPPRSHPQPDHPHRTHRFLRMLLTEGATLLVSKIDFAKLFHDMLGTFMPDHEEQAEEECGCDDACGCDLPHVAVADVGTVIPTDYENFE